VLLVLYAVANALFHAEVLLNFQGGEEAGIHGGLAVIIMIITVMAGRVVGFFIERGLDSKVRTYPWAEHLAIWGTALFMICQFFQFKPGLTVIVVIAASGHLVRLVGWYNSEIWRVPLLWVLYMGYIWLFAGFVLTALELNGIIAETLAIHTFTVGTIGVMTLGMMARVALGHTGREMKSHPAINISFLLVNLAMVTRVVFPLIFPEQYLRWIQITGWLWILAFVIFCFIYVPILIKPRVDGRPG
ncbi:MAG: NnrS family protein, partial [Gammaproteobacteria bacterium]